MQQIEAIIAAATQAGDLALRMQADGLRNIRTKATEIDLVTEADVASEQLLRAALDAIEPGIGFWGEESYAVSGRPQRNTYWLVDPVDGTVNYAHGLAYWAVNVALVRDGHTELAVTVQNPWRRIYWAARGQGAWLREPNRDERRLAVCQVHTLAQALLASGFPYHSHVQNDNNLREYAWFTTRCLGMRVLGAGAIDIAQVAAGILAGFWEGWLEAWDAAAGALLVSEAGGVVTDYAGNTWAPGGPGFIASNGHIHAALIDGIRIARTDMGERLLAV